MVREEPTLLYLRIPQFEAAVLQAVQPGLRTRPVLVVSSFRALGRVLAASPEARQSGVEEGMTLRLARERCPEGRWFTPDPELEERALQAVFAAAANYSPLVERAGRGSLLLDTAGLERLFGRGVDLAARLQREVRERYRLPNALGLARRRSWSALAERFAEPDGIFALLPGLEAGFIDLISPAWLEGIGPKTRERLLEMNLTRLGQLRQFDRSALLEVFGAPGRVLADTLDGAESEGPVLAAEASRRCREAGGRIEAAAVLAEETVAAEPLQVVVRTLAATAAGHLRARGLGAARLHLRLFYNDGRSVTGQVKLSGFVQSETQLRDSAGQLLTRLHQRRVRLAKIWLRVERFAPPQSQAELFAPAPVRQEAPLVSSLDRIRQRFGANTIGTGLDLLYRNQDRPRLGGGN